MKFQAKRGRRVNRQGRNVAVAGMWWTPKYRTWSSTPYEGAGFTSHAPCRTLRAFRRMLRKNPQIKGLTTFYSKWRGYELYA